MMHLDVLGYPIALDAFNAIALPQRVVAVQPLAVQARYEVGELFHRAGVGKADETDVVVDVEVLVLYPTRRDFEFGETATQLEVERFRRGDRHIYPVEHVLKEIALVARRQLQDLQAGDMRRAFVSFDGKKG